MTIIAFEVRDLTLTSKAVIVNELITDHNLDVFGLTETWLIPRTSHKVGGVAKFMIANFELLVMKSTQPTKSLFIATVYRPPGPFTAFLTELN